MSNYRDACIRNSLDLILYSRSAFQLDCIAAGFLDEAACVDHSIVYGRLIGHERHIHNDENIIAASDNCRAVMDHIFHGNRECIRISQHGIPQGIAHQDHVDPGTLHQPCCRIIVTGKHGDLLAGFLHFH